MREILKIERWWRVAAVVLLGGIVHAHLDVRARRVTDCEELRWALGDPNVARIFVSGRIFLGDCVWPDGGVSKRDVVIIGGPSAVLECASEEHEHWKLGYGMRVYLSSITLVDSSAQAPTRLSESCFLLDAQITYIALSHVKLTFLHMESWVDPQSFLDISKQQQSARFCRLNSRGVFIEEVEVQAPGRFEVDLRQAFIHSGSHPLSLRPWVMDECSRGRKDNILTFVVVCCVAPLTFATFMLLVALVTAKKGRGSGQQLNKTSWTGSISNFTDCKHDGQFLPFGELSLGPIIGRGCFSTVYRGAYMGAKVAVKVFEHDDRSLKDDDKSLEAYLACSTDHPNVVKSIAYKTCRWSEALSVLACIEAEPSSSSFSSSSSDAFDFLEESRTPPGKNWFKTWLVMEYCDHGSLFSAIKMGLFQDSRSGEWKIHDIVLTALDIALALEHLHSKGIIHGDLKTQNVLLSADPNDPRGFRCKVGDFGFSRLALNTTHIDTYTCGSVRAMPPELLKDGVLTPSADVYSFGILLWELLAGTTPYKGWSHQLILHNVVEGERPEMNHAWPHALTRLIEDCLQHKYLNRPNFSMITRRLSTMKLSPELQYEAIRRSFETREPGFDDQIHCFNLRSRTSHHNHFPSSAKLEVLPHHHLEELPSQLASISNPRKAAGNI